MMNFLLWAAMFALTTSLFSFTFSLGGVARSFEGVTNELVQEAVVAPGLKSSLSANLGPYFDERVLTADLEKYFSENLAYYVSDEDWSFSLSFSAYQLNLTSLNGLTSQFFPQQANLSFQTSYAGIYDYSNSRAFLIKKGDLYGG
jgi:hypothetical protein